MIRYYIVIYLWDINGTGILQPGRRHLRWQPAPAPSHPPTGRLRPGPQSPVCASIVKGTTWGDG